ncbi:MAG TPA: hypothetical protein VJ767_01955 [Nitrososphaeraceae archaeon]|nr:hypothetical protein [Nitrososphaeraceae archaeon]
MISRQQEQEERDNHRSVVYKTQFVVLNGRIELENIYQGRLW